MIDSFFSWAIGFLAKRWDIELIEPNTKIIMPIESPQAHEMAPASSVPAQVAPAVPVQPAFPTMIVKWARSIGKWEGANPTSHNLGNLKYSTLTASWGATKGHPASDGGFLCQFQDNQTGLNALCNFLVLGAEDQLIAFHAPEARTLEGFTKIYAGGPPAGYINGIIQDMNVPGNTQISTFLS